MQLLGNEVSYVINIPWWVSLIFLVGLIAAVAVLVLFLRRIK